MLNKKHFILDCNGSIIILVVVAIIAIAGLSVGMSQMSSISTLNQLEFNQANNARNLAYSGVEYIKGLIYYEKSLNKSAANFLTDITASAGEYSLGTDKGSFVISIPTSSTTGNTVSFTVSSIGKSPSGAFHAEYQIPSSVSLSYTYTPTTPVVNPNVPQVLNVASTMNFSGDSYYGDSTFNSATFNGGVKIYGSLNYIASGSSCLNLNAGGSFVGNASSSSICSTTCIAISGWTTVTGTVTAQGDVNIISGNVYGDVYSGGNVTIKGNSTVYGSVYATGNISIISGKITGTQNKLSSKPTNCKGYTLKDYVQQTPTQAAVNVGWINTPYMITGSTNMNDKSWVFPSFAMTNGGTKLCLDLSTANSYVNIFVNGNFQLAGTVQLKTTSNGSCADASSYSQTDLKTYAKRIYMAVGGTTKFEQSAQFWVGTIFSQKDITASSTLSIVGALYTKGAISTGGGTTSIFVMSDYANANW